MAEKFLVHPVALDGYAKLLERNYGHVAKMRDYLDGPGSEAKGLMGVMFALQNAAEALAGKQRETLHEIISKMAATTQGLRDAADSYATVDTTAAARMDKTLPEVPDTGRKHPGGR